MAEKELLAYLIAHNLVRCLIAEAVARHSVELERVSFSFARTACANTAGALEQARTSNLRSQLWRIYCSNWPAIWFRSGPIDANRAPVKRHPKPIRSQPTTTPVRDLPTAAVTGRPTPPLSGLNCAISRLGS
jgi:hypothetical protein